MSRLGYCCGIYTVEKRAAAVCRSGGERLSFPIEKSACVLIKTDKKKAGKADIKQMDEEDKRMI